MQGRYISDRPSRGALVAPGSSILGQLAHLNWCIEGTVARSKSTKNEVATIPFQAVVQTGTPRCKASLL